MHSVSTFSNGIQHEINLLDVYLYFGNFATNQPKLHVADNELDINAGRVKRFIITRQIQLYTY